MELYQGAHQIQSLFGVRNLFQYLLTGDRLILVDSGIAATPESTILPYIERLGYDPRRLSMVITTHPDLDHQGGNSAIRRVAASALFACGEADRELVEDPRTLYSKRYNYMRSDHDVGFEEQPPSDAGAVCAVDIGYRGGERIALSDGWEVEVLHLPGHSRGHLALYDRVHKAAFVSDAVHGNGCPKADGTLAIPVTYYYVDTYLSTLQYLEQLQIDALYTGHWPIMRREEVSDFLADSRRTVARLDRRFLRALSASTAGLTLKDLIAEAAEEFPEWPQDTRELAMFSVKGHLDRLEAQNKVRLVSGYHPLRWLLS